MEQKHKTKSFKKLLDRLQEDSWQLELLISAFAIFGLFYMIEPLTHSLGISQFNSSGMAVKFYQVIILSIYILIFNLVLHLLFRALWISSLGLRYVSGEINFDELNYSEKFTKYLKKKVGSFDAYICKLENLSSVMFAISFLLIFYVLVIFIMVFAINNNLTKLINTQDGLALVVVLIFGLFFYIGALLTFIDFITQGLLKKNKWVSMIYFPFYWVFSILTLSFLYRPLVYNFLDNKFGRQISFTLLPFYVFILILNSLYYQTSNFIPIESTKLSNTNIASGRNYEDIVKNSKNLFIKSFAIQSKVISEPYIKVIIPLRKQIEDHLTEFNTNLKQEEDIHGYQSSLSVQIGGLWINKPKVINNDSIRKVYLNTFEKYYSFKIDTIAYKTDFVIANNDDNLGFETYIGIKDLKEGKHIIEFQKLKHKDTDSLVSIAKVPFWYYKD